MNMLRVELAGDSWSVSPDLGLTFGRDADLVVDSNRYLHRRLGTFRCRDGVWWLINVGSAIKLEVLDCGSPSALSLAPGTSTPLPFTECWVRFSAGPTPYELHVSIPGVDRPQPDDRIDDGSTTIGASTVSLNEEQRDLLVALAEHRMRRTAPTQEMPTNREVAARLGWTITKYNRKLDNLCSKFDRLGVAGIKGDLGGMAVSRRERLVDHVVTAGIIRPQDLARLDEDIA